MSDKSDIIIGMVQSIDLKLDAIVEIQGKQAVTQAEQAKDIAHHISRTDALQGLVNSNTETIKSKLSKPTLKQVSLMVTILTAIGGFVYTYWI